MIVTSWSLRLCSTIVLRAAKATSQPVRQGWKRLEQIQFCMFVLLHIALVFVV